MDIKEKIKEKILELIGEKHENNLWFMHINNVVRYSKMLAKKLGVDEEVCEISAWLHDISKLEGVKGNHHITGAERAKSILENLGYEEEKIKIVESSIITHSSDKNYVPKTIEQKILASADALAFFEDFLLFVKKISDKYSQEEVKKILVEKTNISWEKVCFLEEAKEMAKPKYEAIMFLLNN